MPRSYKIPYIQVRIKLPKAFKFRLWVGNSLLELARKVMPLEIKVQHDGELYLYRCPKCYRSYYDTLPENGGEAVICCDNCGFQRLIKNINHFIMPINEPTCGYACHWDEVFGFVPEAGCPFHD